MDIWEEGKGGNVTKNLNYSDRNIWKELKRLCHDHDTVRLPVGEYLQLRISF